MKNGALYRDNTPLSSLEMNWAGTSDLIPAHAELILALPKESTGGEFMNRREARDQRVMGLATSSKLVTGVRTVP